MDKMKDYPYLVLEAYDTIEKLLVPKGRQPLVNFNSTTSNCLLMILNDLYETNSDNLTPSEAIAKQPQLP